MAYSRSPLYPPRGTRRSGRGGLLSLTPLPTSGNQTLGQRGPTHLYPSTRLGEPDARAEVAYSRLPLYPPRGTRRSGRGGLLTCTPLPVSGNQTLGQRGPTLAHPSTRLGEPDARAEGAYSRSPLYPPRGTRCSGRGGLLTCTPLPVSGNQTLGQRGPTLAHPSTRLDLSHPRTPFLRGPPGPPGGTPTRPPGEPGHPTLKPGVLIRPNRALRRTGPLVTPGEIYHWSPLVDLGFGRLASDFQGPDGSLPPRLREPDARAGGAFSPSPIYPPRGTRRSGRGGLLSLTPLPASTSLVPGLLSSEGPPGPPGGTPTRPPGEPGHPTLKPGSLTLPNRTLRRTGPLVTPGEIYHWSPLIDLGFVRLVSDLKGEPGAALCPRLRLSPRGGRPSGADPGAFHATGHPLST